ncbi:MAG: alpha-2-macroglobulin family protein [Pirellulaceae bacterium]
MRDPVQYTLEHLDDYLHDLLSAEDARYVEEQCEKSSICRAAFEEAQKRFQALKAIPPSEASEELIRQTVEGVDMKVNRSTRNWRIFSRTLLAVTAAAVLIIGVANFYYYNLAPSPYDVRLLGQENLLSGSLASLHVAVFDRNSGKLVPGTPVELALYNPQDDERVQLVSFTTGEESAGAARFQLPDWPGGDYQLEVTARPGGNFEKIVRDVQLKREWKLLLSTDKPVYKPGQVIHLRSLALRKPDLKPVAGNDVTFTVTDPKGNIVFRQHDVTSEFGLAATDFQLASEVNEGKYEIECVVGDTTSRRSVEVQRYVLPKFRVTVDLEQPYYAPGEKVAGSVQADYFFGQPVSGADVSIEARPVGFDSRSIETLELQTDDKGHVNFEFTLPNRLIARPQDGGDARIQVAAVVTDTAGQTYSAGSSRPVTSEPIHLDVIPESGMLVKGVENIVYIYASYADGRPAEVKLLVSGQDQQLETSPVGVAEITLTPDEDEVGLTLKATDDAGRTARRHVDLACGQVGGDFVLRSDEAVYDGGATMTLTAHGGGVEPVFVDLVKDGQTMLSATIDLAGGAGNAEIDLPTDVFGTLRLVAFRFDNRSGLAIRKERTIFVRQAKELSIDAKLDHQQYRPGESAQLRVTLTDADGKPTVGAVSLAAVDEAVFSVLNQATGMERVFFLLEEELLEPVYAIYNGWSPEALGNLPLVERQQFNRALFSRTAGSVDGLGAVPAQFAARLVEDQEAIVLIDDSGSMEYSANEGGSPFTLAAQSFPEKLREVTSRRDAGLQSVVIAWGTLVGALLLTAVVTFAVYRPKAFLITSAVVLALGTVSICGLGMLIFNYANKSMDAAAGGVDFDMAMPQAAMEFADGGAMEMTGEAAAAADDANDDLAKVESPDPAADEASAPAKPRVRQFFPETLLWKPELVTDEQGVATLDIALADSITTWRLSASAVSGSGQLGAADFPIQVFQPFFVDLDLPVALTRGDRVAVPVVVYNYLDRPQTVKLELKDDAWFSRGAATDVQPSMSLELAPREVRSLTFPIQVEKVGLHQLEVTAIAGDVADALRREIEVIPNGKKIETTASGMLRDPAEVSFTLPDDAIEGSARTIVKLYPSSFSQLVEGLDAIFRMPGGCFEQTSSTTYPNVLALDYLRRTGKSVPAVEAKARQYLNVGYQRLVTFEVSGGGFDWFGNPPANRTLTAYGLMEFEDMAKVHDVDPQLIARTRQWLLSQRRGDGSWPAERGMLNDGLAGSVNRGEAADLASTAYIAWAVFGAGEASAQAPATLNYLLRYEPGTIGDTYVLAAVIRAISGIDAKHRALDGYLDSLVERAESSDDGKLAWWKQSPGGQTTFYGSGLSGDIETTAMAALALLQANREPAMVKAALSWLAEQKDPHGTWHSTQATVLALKALLEGTSKPLGGEQRRQLEIVLDGETVRTLDIAADQADVMQQIDLTDLVTPGEHQLTLRETTGTGTGYQVLTRHYIESDEPSGEGEPLTIDVAYDRQRLDVDDTVTATASVTNNMPQTAPMVILDLPIPGGFALEAGELDELVGSRKIAKYQLTPRKAIVYLRGLAPGEKLELRYRLRAKMAVKVAVAAAEAYEYYDPAKRGVSEATELEAVAE